MLNNKCHAVLDYITLIHFCIWIYGQSIKLISINKILKLNTNIIDTIHNLCNGIYRLH